MNTIRTTKGEPTINCIDHDTILSNIDNFYVEVKVVYSFFDAKTYDEKKQMEYAQTYT